MRILPPLLAVTLCSATSLFAQTPVPEAMFPFVIPGSTAPVAGSLVDVSWLNDAPAGAHGFIRAQDGHFIDGAGKRVRFLASNFTFGSCFPEHEMADKLAARLASLGINCIRFHHLDNQTAPSGIWKAGLPKKNQFDPDQLARLDYFIAALKRHGVYADLNLHISRNYWEGEDFPDGLADNRERQEKLPSYGKALDKINDQMVRMQRDYARALLTHVNPYTHNPYAKEPCVALVEINNENSLLQLKVESLPDYYRQDILGKWNRWLQARYGSPEKLQAAWGGDEPLGHDLLPARWTIQGGEYFSVTPAPAGAEAASGPELQVSLKKLPDVDWHAQLQWPGMTLENGKLYTLEFTARSAQPRRLAVSTRLNQPDWHNCGLSEEAALGPKWKTFSFPFRAVNVEPGAVRVDMVVGAGSLGDFFLKGLSLRRGGSLGLKPGESLAAGNVAAPLRTQGTPRGLDWTRFLAETERAYTDGMRNFLKQDLGVEAAIIDTQASYGGIAGTYRESFNDYVDMHAYWQHPNFPGRPWDGANWTIRNTPMVADHNGGNLAHLAEYRVGGKPFTVSEYDHPAPNQYAAEMFPMIASFAAVQDWDGFFQFDWGGTDPDSRRISGYFSLQQHPAKLAFLPAAALMFRRADVPPAPGTAHLAIPRADVEELTADDVSMAEAWKKAGVSTAAVLSHRCSLNFGSKPKLAAEISPENGCAASWDETAAIYTVDAPAAKVLVGHCSDKTIALGDVQFAVKRNPRDFAVLVLNAVDGKPMASSRRILLAAAGDVENTGMDWNAAHTSVGTHWGQAPTVCEGIEARLTVSTTAKSARVFALDGSGARAAEVPAQLAGGKLTLEISAKFHTLWYELALE